MLIHSWIADAVLLPFVVFFSICIGVLVPPSAAALLVRAQRDSSAWFVALARPVLVDVNSKTTASIHGVVT